MRVMVIVKASKESEAGEMPSEKILTEMGTFNEELVKAGVMLEGEGLHPTSKGKRVKFSGEQRTVIDGPFAESKELIAGFWLWQVKSMDEAVEWLKRAPFGTMSYRLYGKKDRIQLLWVLSVPGATPDSIAVSDGSQRDEAIGGDGRPWLMLSGTPGAHIMIPINK